MGSSALNAVRRVSRPAERLMSRLSYPQRFALVGVVLVAPLAYVAWAYTGVQRANTGFAHREQVGITYLRPLTGLLNAVVQERAVGVLVATGHAPAARLTAAERQVSTAAAAVSAARGSAATLGLTVQWAALSRQLASPLAPGSSPAQVVAHDSALSTAVQSLIAQDGNNSNMILDPASDSYYLMDATLNRIPALVDVAGRAADTQSALATVGRPGMDDLLGLEDLRASITETESADLVPDYRSAIANTHDHALAGQVRAPLAALQSALAASSRQLVSAVHGHLDPADAQQLAAQVRQRGAALEAATVPAMVHLLDVRTAGYEHASWMTFLIALLGVLLAAYLFIGFYESVRLCQLAAAASLSFLHEHCTEPLRRALDALAEGDLTRRLEIPQDSGEECAHELGFIIDGVNAIRAGLVDAVVSFNATCEKLRGVLGGVHASAGSVGDASREMSSSSSEADRATDEIAAAVGGIATGAERQAMMLIGARETAERVVSAMGSSAERAQRAADTADQASRIVEDGTAAAREADAAMHAVLESSQAATTAIAGLQEKSSQITVIIETITGIAEQTNLLALNASIEAARAGDHGKGFAVVADEVRRLAEDCHRATAEIAALVDGIQSETAATVTAVQNGTTRTAHGAEVMERTREAFDRIGETVRDVTGHAHEIAEVSRELSGSIVEIRHGIDEIATLAEESSASSQEVSASTQQTAAMATQIATEAERLAGTASHLEELVGGFVLSR